MYAAESSSLSSLVTNSNTFWGPFCQRVYQELCATHSTHEPHNLGVICCHCNTIYTFTHTILQMDLWESTGDKTAKDDEMMKSIEDSCCLLLMAEEKSFLMAEEERIRGKYKFIKCFCNSNSSKTMNTSYHHLRL